MNQSDRDFIHKLYVQYYAGKEYLRVTITDQNGKAKCLGCGYKRKIGTRGPGRGRCKACRRFTSTVSCEGHQTF